MEKKGRGCGGEGWGDGNDGDVQDNYNHNCKYR